jgi:hypothetical protein
MAQRDGRRRTVWYDYSSLLPYDDCAKLTARGVGHGSVPAGDAFRDNTTPTSSLLAFLRPNSKTCPGTTT